MPISILLLLCSNCSNSDIQLESHRSTKPRLIVMADMGNEPDEMQQMMHLLMYCNEVQIEGLISVSGTWLHRDWEGDNEDKKRLHPDLFHQLIDGYAEVRPNLQLHAAGWPDPEYLHSITFSGTDVYGMNGVGEGKSTSGSDLIKSSILKEDSSYLYIVVNAGSNTMAQALFELKSELETDQLKNYTRNIIVFENGSQDNAGAWIALNFPEIAWHRSNSQTYAYGGSDGSKDWMAIGGPYTWEPYDRTPQGQHAWAYEHIQSGHGPLGALYPDRFDRKAFIEGGGTIPWMCLVNKGLSDPTCLQWGGWSGRFSETKKENVYSGYQKIRAHEEVNNPGFFMYESDSEIESWKDPVHSESFTGNQVPVWRFRRAMYNDIRARMDWCISPFKEANHNPVAVLNGNSENTILSIKVTPGETIFLDASESYDPDQEEDIKFKWWFYKEAGTCDANIALDNSHDPAIQFLIPRETQKSELHLILEVKDTHKTAPMHDYRRIILNIE